MTHQKEQKVWCGQGAQAIAARLEDVLKTPNAAESLAGELQKTLLSELVTASVAVKKAVRGDDDASTELKQAYDLGQLSFAQGFAAQMAINAEPSNFQTFLNDAKYQKYVKALLSEDLCGVLLAEQVEETPESVSRKLRELREAGVTEFRREGRSVVNFLTPIARAAFEAEGMEMQRRSSSNANILKNLGSKLQPFLQSQMNFSGSSTPQGHKEKCHD